MKLFEFLKEKFGEKWLVGEVGAPITVIFGEKRYEIPWSLVCAMHYSLKPMDEADKASNVAGCVEALEEWKDVLVSGGEECPDWGPAFVITNMAIILAVDHLVKTECEPTSVLRRVDALTFQYLGPMASRPLN